MSRPIPNWTPDMSTAFVAWRQRNQRAYTYPIANCLNHPEILEEFRQWYAVERLMGRRKPETYNPKESK
ncbi:hypothetical protein QTI66_32700 [Variovorax sp. J22R133]|uniref:hypothetical protein n=1 Tax=Variovorax brevis TaxID=3053503 RepID=UPI0025777D06|nr:hypothetical protein [Variovorax sp. J22R133]MDM0116888.1 hypothetical protein [Variovorax sp. J22R133]